MSSSRTQSGATCCLSLSPAVTPCQMSVRWERSYRPVASDPKCRHSKISLSARLRS